MAAPKNPEIKNNEKRLSVTNPVAKDASHMPNDSNIIVRGKKKK
jgi:hypothetical protein